MGLTYKRSGTGSHSSLKGAVKGIYSGAQLLWHNVSKHGAVVAATPVGIKLLLLRSAL